MISISHIINNKLKFFKSCSNLNVSGLHLFCTMLPQLISTILKLTFCITLDIKFYKCI